MARVKAFQTFFTTRQSDTYRLLILDEGASVTGGVNAALYGYAATTTTTPRDINIAHDSVMVSWDAPTDTVHSAIIGSRLEVTYIIDPDNYYFTDIIKARQEGEICCVLQRHKGLSTSINTSAYPTSSYETVFIGCLSPEAVEFDFSNPPFELKLIFTDGISLLRDIAYEKENGDPWTDDATFETFRTQIGNCLSRLPHLSAFDDGINDRFFTEQLDIFHYNHADTDGDLAETSGEPASILDKSGCNQNIWYETRLHDNPFNRKHRVVTGGSTCYEVIEDIMTSLGATFMAHRGSFWAVSPFLQTDQAVTNEERAFKADLRTMTDSSFQDSAYTTGTSDLTLDSLQNRYDFRSADILLGSTRSYMNPAKAVMYTHSKGGAPYIFKYTMPITAYGDVFAQNTFVPAPLGIDPTTPSYDSGFGGYGSIITQEGPEFPISNPDYKFVGGQELLVKGRVVIDSVLDAQDDAFVGAQPVIKMKIKVGDKYLKQTTNIVPDSELDEMDNFGRIHIAIANPMNPSGGDFTGWQPVEITSDPEWTDVVGDRFEFPFMIEGQMEPPIDTVEYTDGEDVTAYPVGMNTRRHENKAERMRFRWEDRKKQHDLKLDFVLPALPGTSSNTYEGIEIDVTVIVWRNTDGEGTMQSIPFDNNLVPYEACRFHNFRVLAGQDIEDEDILYVASADDPQGLESIDGGSSLLASRLDTYFGDIGMLKSNEPGHRENDTEVDGYGQYWYSESESGRTPGTGAGKPSMEVVANSHLAIRQELREIYNLSFLTKDHHDPLLWPLRRILIETGNPDAIVQIMSCTHHVMASQYDIYAFELGQKYTAITGTTSVDANAIFRKGPAPLPGPRPVSKVSSTSGLNAEAITKLGAIGLTGGSISTFDFGDNTNVIPAEQIETDQDREFIGAQLKSTIGTDAQARLVTDLVTTTGAGASRKITSITTTDGELDVNNSRDVERAITITEVQGQKLISEISATGSNVLNTSQISDGSSTKKFATSSEKTKVGHLTGDEDGITDITTGDGTSIDLEDTRQKAGFISKDGNGITQFTTSGGGGTDVNLYHIHNALLPSNTTCTNTGDYTSTCNAIERATYLPDPSTDRSGQTGERILTIDESGDFQEVTDGTKDQVLKTSGAGVLSFTSLTYPVACLSGRVTTSYANNYYYGSSSYGWNYPIWSSISFNNLQGNPYARNVIDDYAHCGIVAPMGIKNLRVYGTVRNDSGTENILLFLGKTATPNGSTSSMVLTELGTQTITVSNQDRHYDVDFTTTGVVAAGDLIFVGIARASTTSGTRYINFSLSIQGTV